MTAVAIDAPAGVPLSAEEVRRLVFHEKRSTKWIHQHCPRHVLSHRVVIFYEAEVRAWVQQQGAA